MKSNLHKAKRHDENKHPQTRTALVEGSVTSVKAKEVKDWISFIAELPNLMNIKEIAKRANVSTATVSRTLNNTAHVEPATAQKVRQAIKELHYRPNITARALASGRSFTIGLLVSDIVNPFFPELVKGFEDAATARGYDVLVANTNYDVERMTSCVRRFIERKVDGVAIMTSEVNRNLIRELERRSIPIVFLDVGVVGRRISNVRVDYTRGMSEAVAHLLALGHNRIAFIAGPADLRSAHIRRTCFLECLKEFGISENKLLMQVGDHKIEGGEAAMNRLLRLKRRATAVLASNDLMAIGALKAVRAANLRVPEDVSVIGFDDIEWAKHADPPLTTISLSRAEIAVQAFAALIGNIDEADARGMESSVKTRLIIRRSTAVKA